MEPQMLTGTGPTLAMGCQWMKGSPRQALTEPFSMLFHNSEFPRGQYWGQVSCYFKYDKTTAAHIEPKFFWEGKTMGRA